MSPRLLATFLFVLVGAVALAAPEYPEKGPDIYEPQADGFTQIDAALAKAKAGNKRLLLIFGANWCIWCRRLHDTFAHHAEVAAAVERNYVVVLVDVNKRKGVARNAAVNERYGNPVQHGLPVLVVLDADGQLITTQETGALEDGNRHDPAKLEAFLLRWAPKK